MRIHSYFALAPTSARIHLGDDALVLIFGLVWGLILLICNAFYVNFIYILCIL